MDELLRRLDEILTCCSLSDLRPELQLLLTSAYRRGAMDFKVATDNVMVALDRQMESYHAYVAQWETPREAGSDAAKKPR